MSALAGVQAATVRGEDWSRRKRALALGSSVATLAALISAAPALAATTVNGGSTAVATSTVASGSADDITQTGTLSVTTGPAITLDSSNSVTNSGTIQLQDVSGVTAILANGGNTGSITNTGTITIGESSTITTTDSAGNVIGPFATGSDRYGIRVVGTSALVGDIANSGTITVQGENSAAISVEAPLTGAITNTGTITASGTNSYGIHTTGTVSGQIGLAGAVSASGAGAQAVVVGADAGSLIVESTVTATGYHQITRSATASVLADEDANDAAQGGAAINVAGSLGSGLLISAPPSVLPADTTADTNGDGIVDDSEPTAVVTSYGSAPAIQLGAVGRDITLGVVGTGDSAYGLVIGGTVSGQSLRDGIAANGLVIGVSTGDGGAANITNGVRVRGSVTAIAYGGDATAMHLYSGANVPTLYNSGTIAATMTGEGTQTATGIVIESGATLSTILNAGAIRGQVVGQYGAATAIVDHSGTLTNVQNIGTITGLTTAATGATYTPSGTRVAIDVSANTTGFSLVNYLPSGWSITPTITGSVLMGSGNDSVDVEAGSITGDLSFGAGANTLTIDGGASVVGALTADNGTLALSVGTGTLEDDSTSHLSLTSLNLGSGSTVVFTADPASGVATEFNVAGTAAIASGAKIDLRLTSLAQGTTTYTLIKADQLNASSIDSSLLGSSPYIYSAQLSTDTTAGTVSVTLARKTATDLGLSSAIAGGYEPVIAAVSTSSSLSAGLLAQTDRSSFLAAYNQLLPEHSGGVFRMISAGSEAFGRPLDERSGDNGGGWLQEVNYAALAHNQGDQLGYRAWGFGLVGGYEFPALNIGSFGLTFGGLTSEMRPHDSPADSQVNADVLEAGGYWRLQTGPFAASVRLAADHLTATGRRAVDLTSDNETLYSGTASGHWSGWGVTSRARVSYNQTWRNLYVKPQLGIDYLQLHEDGYQEGGGGVLDLTVDSRKTTELTGFAGVAIGAVFGDAGATWSPELLLGYRDVLSSSGGSTTAAFSGGEAFTVGPLASGDSGAVARIAVRSGNGPTTFAFEGGAEARDSLTIYDIKLSAIFRF